MSDIAIRIENLSKAYRIGLAEQRHETLMGAMTSFIKSPLENFRNVRKLSRFNDVGSDIRTPTSDLSTSPSDVIWALRDVSFEVKHGEAIGIIGRNGAGKSTLLKILARITEPTSGRATIYGRVGSLLEVGTGFHPDLTGRENVYLNGTILGMKKREVDAKFDEIVEFSGVEKFIDTPVKRYSSGMRVRLAFAVAAHLEPEILIVDEVLAVGDAEFQKKCLGKMEDVSKEGRTVLFVSHNMAAVSNLCGRGLVLTDGKIAFKGNVNDAVQHYSQQVAASGQRDGHLEPHVLYLGPTVQSNDGDCTITRIEVLDENRNPKPTVSTWDRVVFRLCYQSNRQINRGSVVLRLGGQDGSRLLLLSTQPDGTLPLDLEPGEHAVDCEIEQFPLSAGRYIVGAGLALPNTAWLWWRSDLCTLSVFPRDVYGSGLAPNAERALLAVKHRWIKVLSSNESA